MATASESAYTRLQDLFASYGLPNAADILNVIREGVANNDGDDIIQIRLQDTDSWKQRFAGNEVRKQKGQNVLSVGEYLSQENQYQNVLRNAGLPAGFYDDHDDFSNLIGNGVSVAELQDRVNIAGDIVNREDPAIVNQLAARGITTGMLLAHALDANRAAPLIKREQNSLLIGAAAERAGVRGVTPSISDSLSERGIGESQATQGFGQISDFLSDTDKLGDVYGVDYDTSDAVNEVFNGGSGDKRKRLARQEKSAFGGQANYGVARRETGGSF